MGLKNILVPLLAFCLLFSLASFVAAEDDDDRHERRESAPAEVITVYEEVPADNSEIVEALDMVVSEISRIEADLARQNASVSQLRYEVAALRSENEILRRRQADFSADSRYFNASINHLVFTLRGDASEGGGVTGDDDGDGVLNPDDRYPGVNDFMMLDSDSDGVSDFDDLFPGEDDRRYQDVDGDGVRDSEDSNLSFDTDLDDDGVDDAYDDFDDSPFVVKAFRWLGFI